MLYHNLVFILISGVCNAKHCYYSFVNQAALKENVLNLHKLCAMLCMSKCGKQPYVGINPCRLWTASYYMS